MIYLSLLRAWLITWRLGQSQYLDISDGGKVLGILIRPISNKFFLSFCDLLCD